MQIRSDQSEELFTVSGLRIVGWRPMSMKVISAKYVCRRQVEINTLAYRTGVSDKTIDKGN